MWLWMVWSISAQYTARSVGTEYRASEYAKTTDERISRTCAALVGPAFTECVTEQVKASREDQRTEYDLQAQQDSAEAAFWMAIIGTATLLATLIALWFVKGTLEATRKAVEETGEATAAMKEANRIASTMTAAELRPYVFIERIELTNIKSSDVEPDETSPATLDPDAPPARKGVLTGQVIIHLHNFGKVPARNITVYSKTYLGRIYAGRYWKLQFRITNLWVCAPNHERRVFLPLYVKEEEREGFDLGVIDFFLRLRYTFEDDAGNRYKESGAFRLDGTNLETFFLLGNLQIGESRKRMRQYELKYAPGWQRAGKKVARRKPAKVANPRRGSRAKPKPKPPVEEPPD